VHKNIWINWSIEFGPIILFFVSLYKLGESEGGFVYATGIFTLATIIALASAYIRDKRIALFPITSGVFVIIFGALTLYSNEPHIFIIKDTVYNGLFAVALFVGLVRGKGLLKFFFGSLFDMKDEGWRILSFRWMIMFIILTVSNEYVWRLYSQNVWVMYKFFATIVTTIFGTSQIFLARRYRNETASPWGMRIVNITQKNRQAN
jgi:intracellular septation protein